MKWLICLLICLCSVGNIVAQDYSFNHYADVEDITRVYISKTLLKAILKNDSFSMKISGDKVCLNGKNLLAKTDGILVLTGTHQEIANMVRDDVAKITHKKEYEKILYHNNKKTVIDIFIRKEKGVIHEILFFDKTDKSTRIIQLVGQFTSEDLLSLMGA